MLCAFRVKGVVRECVRVSVFVAAASQGSGERRVELTTSIKANTLTKKGKPHFAYREPSLVTSHPLTTSFFSSSFLPSPTPSLSLSPFGDIDNILKGEGAVSSSLVNFGIDLLHSHLSSDSISLVHSNVNLDPGILTLNMVLGLLTHSFVCRRRWSIIKAIRRRNTRERCEEKKILKDSLS